MEKKSNVTMKAAPVDLCVERCLNIRHFRAKCSYCIDACPVAAVRLKDRLVSVDDQACTGCGICLTICPMEVFTTRNWSERTVLDVLTDLKGGSAEIICSIHPDRETGAARPAMVTIGACLAALSPGLLFEAALAKKIGLRVDACRGCGNGRALAYIERAVSLADSWLSAVGRGKQITLSLSSPPVEIGGNGASRFHKIEADERRFNRRGFLTGFAREGSALFAAFLGLSPVKAGIIDAKKSPQSIKQPHVHQWRQALSQVYPQAPDETGAAPLWPHIEVKDSCAGCAVCEKYCPTRALRFEADGTMLTMLFNPGLCADCALCALACPMEAITRGYAGQTHPFCAQTIFQEKLTVCPRCQNPALKSENPLCYWCASEPPLDSLLDAAKRNLFSRK